MAERKVIKSFTLSQEVIDHLNLMVFHYWKQQETQLSASAFVEKLIETAWEASQEKEAKNE